MKDAAASLTAWSKVRHLLFLPSLFLYFTQGSVWGWTAPMYSMWTGGFGHHSVPVSQPADPEREPSIQLLSLEITWWSTVSRVAMMCLSGSSTTIWSVSPHLIASCLFLPGGNVHIHYQEEKCYDEEIFFYHLGCHQWVSAGESFSHRKFQCLTALSDPTDTQSVFINNLFILFYSLTWLFMHTKFSAFLSGGEAVRGRYSHVAAVMEGRVLLVAGGYSGVARGDLVAYKVPLFVSSDPGDRVSEKGVVEQEHGTHQVMSLVRSKNLTKRGCGFVEFTHKWVQMFEFFF